MVLGNTLTTLSEGGHDEGLRHRSGVESQTVVVENVVCGKIRGVSGFTTTGMYERTWCSSLSLWTSPNGHTF